MNPYRSQTGMNYPRDRNSPMADRAALFGGGASSSGGGGASSSAMGGGGGAGGSSNNAMIYENENDALVNGMAGKISALKDLTINIRDEVRDHNKHLDQMELDFGNAGGLLGNTMKRLGIMTNAGHNSHMCYLIIFILVVFFIMWRMI
eukprot:Nk52_evm8s233 gene=Nk52_evmTU8s233